MQATTPDSFKLTPDQIEANRLLGSAARHIMLYGGSRSGKTFLILRAQITRRMAVQSRGVALRYRFNHIKASVIYDTLPKVMDLCFPGVMEHCHLDKSDWFLKFPNGSELWFGGLDDKERTEKILGQEYSDIFLNECSQIPWQSRNMAMTRLAQNTSLRLKTYYDCNPPSEAHWTCQVFVNKLDPEKRQPLADPSAYAVMRLNPEGNRANLAQGYFDELGLLPEKMRRRFLLGEFGTAAENALWSYSLLDKCRILEGSLPDLQRVIIAVDPSGCSGEEDTRSDEVGIVVVGLGVDGKAYVLEDLSGRFGPSQWGQVVVAAYDRFEADAIVAETNFGGAMVGEVIRAAQPGNAPRIPVREVKASRGKHVRAEPVSALYEQGKVIHAGFFERLEEQLCSMTTAGYAGGKSPDRADALVWGINDLFPALTRRDRTHDRPLQTMAHVGHAKLKQAWQ